ncbi:conserved hypothetical protein [Microsporum canis CBS 113480]|uniref:DASH complex subunit DAD3 n=1 Tax=Arthroderma otae (strain ATCC MYA-4605 / CBS 113480) TaxID=554155 RepID=C5FJL3_ARTOC|nr:conserved hypothetical protein [Microsporum canis CBS 113480]EEQ30874.1 conserved hypothetical protein [Microsporum canis CBS 113480]
MMRMNKNSRIIVKMKNPTRNSDDNIILLSPNSTFSSEQISTRHLIANKMDSYDTSEAGFSNPLIRDNPLLSPLEQEVLDEYSKLLENMNKLSTSLNDLAVQPSSDTLDALRVLERKTATVYTLLKASVYSIVLQQQIYNGGDEGHIGDNYLSLDESLLHFYEDA